MSGEELMRCPWCGAERDHPGMVSSEHQEYICGAWYAGDGSPLQQSAMCVMRVIARQLLDLQTELRVAGTNGTRENSFEGGIRHQAWDAACKLATILAAVPGGDLAKHVGGMYVNAQRLRRMETIVRALTHRETGCLCDRCLKEEAQVAKVVGELQEKARLHDALLKCYELGNRITTKQEGGMVAVLLVNSPFSDATWDAWVTWSDCSKIEASGDTPTEAAERLVDALTEKLMQLKGGATF